MLVLLPPSEGKSAPRRGRPLDLETLSFPSLHGPRATVLDALVRLCNERPAPAAADLLGLGPTQHDAVTANARLLSAPTARADTVYSGVLYEALGLPALEPAQRRRAARRLAITSALFGLLRPGDRIPAYRLSGQVRLPGIGSLGRHWAAQLDPVVREQAADSVIVDLRSSTYVPFWRPARADRCRVVTVRVLQESQGRRTVVSHFNKATKGRLTRDLLEDRSPRRADELVVLLRDLGWRVEVAEQTSTGPRRLDVVVDAW